jgi:hypothetical protein
MWVARHEGLNDTVHFFVSLYSTLVTRNIVMIIGFDEKVERKKKILFFSRV